MSIFTKLLSSSKRDFELTIRYVYSLFSEFDRWMVGTSNERIKVKRVIFKNYSFYFLGFAFYWNRYIIWVRFGGFVPISRTWFQDTGQTSFLLSEFFRLFLQKIIYYITPFSNTVLLKRIQSYPINLFYLSLLLFYSYCYSQ